MSLISKITNWIADEQPSNTMPDGPVREEISVVQASMLLNKQMQQTDNSILTLFDNHQLSFVRSQEDRNMLSLWVEALTMTILSNRGEYELVKLLVEHRSKHSDQVFGVSKAKYKALMKRFPEMQREGYELYVPGNTSIGPLLKYMGISQLIIQSLPFGMGFKFDDIVLYHAGCIGELPKNFIVTE